jgi:hypothetical protein
MPIQFYRGKSDFPYHPRDTPKSPTAQRANGENGYIGGLYMCTNYGFRGTCSYARYNMSVCYNLAAPFANNVTSISPDNYVGDDKFKFKCSMWDGENCAGTNDTLVWPGTMDLWVDEAAVDKRGKSVMCEFTSPDGLETYKAWKEQGYNFDKLIDRPRECKENCR